jgi:hypothetical protein
MDARLICLLRRAGCVMGGRLRRVINGGMEN